MPIDHSLFFDALAKRYLGATPEALMAVMCPILIRISSLDKKIVKLDGQKHYRATFFIELDEHNESIVQVGRTGKFLPGDFEAKGTWNEIAKGRIVSVDRVKGIAEGEIYTGEPTALSLTTALSALDEHCLWEVDQYGASAKILSALAEHFLVQHGKARGYKVVRMPEDMARHLGAYANFDFMFEKDGKSLRVEAKSLWGTNTKFARLIHSTTTAPKGPEAGWTDAQKKNYYPTSSCKFATQDIFAVNLFLRTGRIEDFAFALSVPEDASEHGLPRASKYPEHVNQNPRCTVDGKIWFDSIDGLWDLALQMQPQAPKLEADIEGVLQQAIVETESELEEDE